MDKELITILDHRQIGNKLKRLAWQIYENNMDETTLWIAGIDKRGIYLSEKIAAELAQISPQKINMMKVLIDRQSFEPTYMSDHHIEELKDGVLILVDDVLNTGKTIVSAMLPLVAKQVKRIHVVVLASRSHRMFPVKADYVGISMATTLQEHLLFDNANENDLKLVLT
jgi:pyrimidine operon attenuation protein / uracil phosphoribosyltransferase